MNATIIDDNKASFNSHALQFNCIHYSIELLFKWSISYRRPPFFRPQPRYTEVIYKVPSQTVNSAQSFVNSYLPNQPLKAETVRNYFTPAQILTSQNLPGVGIRYFIPAYHHNQHVKTHKKQDDAKHNDIETNEIDDSYDDDAPSDVQWKFEKNAAKSSQQTSSEVSVTVM